MAPGTEDAEPRLYSATYSNSPVYELAIGKDHHVMRRRGDDWINATHILKVADLDKPARTRVLEKEVQQDIHEKVQGGYGKYQGTWVPLARAKTLAEKYNVYEVLKQLFDYQPGNASPPPAPKHTTAASSKPKAPKVAAPRKAAGITKPHHITSASAVLTRNSNSVPIARREEYHDTYDNFSEQLNQEMYTPDESTIGSPSVIDEDEYGSTRKRRKTDNDNYAAQKEEIEHQEWSDQLLDYFMLRSEESAPVGLAFPQMPSNAKVDRPIDNEAHTALHWACAMGDIDVVQYLLGRKASMDARNIRGETPLIRAAIFSNCHDKETWAKMIVTLRHTITLPDNHGGTVFHHIAYTAQGGSRSRRALYYFKILLAKFKEWSSPSEFQMFLNSQDSRGDTAFHVVARNSGKCRKLFLGYGLSTNIPNADGVTVDEYLRQKTSRLVLGDNTNLPLSSSPIQGENPFTIPNTSPSKFPISSLGSFNKQLRSTSSQTFQRGLNSLINTNLTAFIETNEAIITGKDKAISDLLRAEQRLKAELSAIRTKNLANAALLEDSEDQASLDLTLESLLSTAEKLEEQTQYHQLHALVRQEESSSKTLNAKEIKDKNAERRAKAHLAHLLNDKINTRRELTRQVVAATADAGMSEQGAALKQMVSRSLGMPFENLIDNLDEIYEHIKEEKQGANVMDMMDTTP